MDRWAKVIQVRLVPPLTYIIRFQNGEKIGPWKSEAAADDVAKVINAAIESHPRMKQLLEIEKAAEKMAEALEQLNMECRMADNRGELAGEVDGGTMDSADKALSAYASAKKENRG